MRRRRGTQRQRPHLNPGPQAILAGTLGIRMAQKAVEIMRHHADLLETQLNADGTTHVDWSIPAPDGAVLSMILEAANDCWGVFDKRDPEERIWSTILQLVELDDMMAQLAAAAG